MKTGGLGVTTWTPSPTWRDTSPGTLTATGTDTHTGLENWILEIKFYSIRCKTILTKVMFLQHNTSAIYLLPRTKL